MTFGRRILSFTPFDRERMAGADPSGGGRERYPMASRFPAGCHGRNPPRVRSGEHGAVVGLDRRPYEIQQRL